MKTNTVAYQSALSEAEKLALLKAAKGSSWYDGWCPHCMECHTNAKMTKTPYGFVCEGKNDIFGRNGCGNMIGWDCKRLEESPLNKFNPIIIKTVDKTASANGAIFSAPKSKYVLIYPYLPEKLYKPKFHTTLDKFLSDVDGFISTIPNEYFDPKAGEDAHYNDMPRTGKDFYWNGLRVGLVKYLQNKRLVNFIVTSASEIGIIFTDQEPAKYL